MFMSELFRLSGAVRRDPAVDTWFRQDRGELGRLVQPWFEAIRRCGPEVREIMHDGCPTACLGDAAFAYVAVFSRHANVGFFRGSELPDPDGLLEGTGRFMRHVKLRPAPGSNSKALRQLIEAAYSDMKARVDIEGPAAGTG